MLVTAPADLFSKVGAGAVRWPVGGTTDAHSRGWEAPAVQSRMPDEPARLTARNAAAACCGRCQARRRAQAWEMRSPSRLPAPLAPVEQRPMASPRAGFGFSVHTGWATLVAITGGFEVVDRRRIDMVDGTDRRRPRFAYHAARELKPA